MNSRRTLEPGFGKPREAEVTYQIDSNTTPILLSVRHCERQRRTMPSITTSKRAGTPKVVDIRNAAPAFE
jgi:hypothetical protein